jgi:hypothetical protein
MTENAVWDHAAATFVGTAGTNDTASLYCFPFCLSDRNSKRETIYKTSANGVGSAKRCPNISKKE